MGGILNEYFSLIFTEEMIMEAKELRCCDVLDHIEIIKAIDSLMRLKVDKSPELDKVLPQTLCKTREEILEALV